MENKRKRKQTGMAKHAGEYDSDSSCHLFFFSYLFTSSSGELVDSILLESSFRFLTIGTFDDVDVDGCVDDFVSLPNTESEFTTTDSVKFDVVNFCPKLSLADAFSAFDTIFEDVASETNEMDIDLLGRHYQ